MSAARTAAPPAPPLRRDERRRRAVVCAVAVAILFPLLPWLTAGPVADRFSGAAAFKSVANLAAFFGVAAWAVSLVLASRIRPVERAFGGLERLYGLHRRLGLIIVALATTHVVFLSLHAAGDALELFLLHARTGRRPLPRRALRDRRSLPRVQGHPHAQAVPRAPDGRRPRCRQPRGRAGPRLHLPPARTHRQPGHGTPGTRCPGSPHSLRELRLPATGATQRTGASTARLSVTHCPRSARKTFSAAGLVPAS